MEETLVVRSFLHSHPLGTLATLNTDGCPELAAIYFFVDKNFSCFFVTKTTTRKYINGTTSPLATLLTVDEHARTSVEIAGTLSLVTDNEQVAHVVTQFQIVFESRADGYWIPPISQIDGEQFVVCELKPHTIHLRDFSHQSEGIPLPDEIVLHPQTDASD